MKNIKKQTQEKDKNKKKKILLATLIPFGVLAAAAIVVPPVLLSRKSNTGRNISLNDETTTSIVINKNTEEGVEVTVKAKGEQQTIESVVVTIGDKILSNSEYTFDRATGKIVILKEGLANQGAITISTTVVADFDSVVLDQTTIDAGITITGLDKIFKSVENTECITLHAPENKIFNIPTFGVEKYKPTIVKNNTEVMTWAKDFSYVVQPDGKTAKFFVRNYGNDVYTISNLPLVDSAEYETNKKHYITSSFNFYGQPVNNTVLYWNEENAEALANQGKLFYITDEQSAIGGNGYFSNDCIEIDGTDYSNNPTYFTLYKRAQVWYDSIELDEEEKEKLIGYNQAVFNLIKDQFAGKTSLHISFTFYIYGAYPQTKLNHSIYLIKE